MGERLTEADIRMFTTLVRFDPVYVGHFKCNLRRIADYTNLALSARPLPDPGIAPTVNLTHFKRHYFEGHPTINPTGSFRWTGAGFRGTPHGRGERFGG